MKVTDQIHEAIANDVKRVDLSPEVYDQFIGELGFDPQTTARSCTFHSPFGYADVYATSSTATCSIPEHAPIERARKCECGAHACKDMTHASWCPLA